ncbi:hypothetical protein [Bilophila sp.]|uniref:hypothetical protein n=1 Tax=Bilophila sp. TaxID=1929485 RepID=UPI0030772355
MSSSLQDFESTWALSPKKDAKSFARLAWLQLLRKGQLPSLPELHAAIQRFASSESWQRVGNWLREQRWLDPLRPFKQVSQGRSQTLRKALQAREEREQRQHEAWRANKARLRPEFEAFAAKLPPVANDAMPFGIWLHLHSLNCAPSADDVPAGTTQSISNFLHDYKRWRPNTEYKMQQETPLDARKDSEKRCRSVREILENMTAPFHAEKTFGVPDFSVIGCV